MQQSISYEYEDVANLIEVILICQAIQLRRLILQQDEHISLETSHNILCISQSATTCILNER